MNGDAHPRIFAGRYRVIGPIGRGAIAEVLRARDDRTDRHVALKIIYPHLRESPTVVERFRREVEVVRRIAHPHVLEILDLVESDGHLFLVMPFHGGGDLADRLAATKRLGVAELRLLAAQVCGALGAAHRAGVVHRDVKPSNVLVGPGPSLDLRLCDFGLARSADLSGLTTANAVLGTPEYMAPEVVTEGHADPRSDIYSLGVMLFEAATGRLPFSGDSPYQLMRQHLDVEAPRARTLAPNLPAAIDDAIARALAKDPLDRFATAEDLARAFDERAPTELAPVPVRLASVDERAFARRACRACGGWLVEAAACCADCGALALRLVWERGGVAVLVDGPGAAADKIDARKHAALYRLLDELPGAPGAKRPKRRRAPRLPFYVARGITTMSARDLVQRLQAIGFEAHVEKGRALAPQKVRERRWKMTMRYAGGSAILLHSFAWKPFDWLGRWGMLVPLSAFAVIWISSFLFSSRRSVRALVDPSASLEGQQDAFTALAATMSGLGSRQDRRLIGRILERLSAVTAATGRAASAALADRAARTAEALAALETRSALTVVSDDAAALEAVRRDEVTRVILRADLLRAASRLDGVHLALTRAGTSASDRSAEIDHEIRELSLALEAEQEVGAVLEGKR